jgi:dTDP-4-dehydrorhamnose reductase
MRIVIFGARGQLGTELCNRLTHDEVLAPERSAADVTDAVAVAQVLDAAKPSFVINATAYNFVDRAEDEPEVAFAANALGPRNRAVWCGSHGVPLLHVSTDYVFSGIEVVDGRETPRQTPYREQDLPGPLSAYGVSKLAGEHFVQAFCPRHFVVRTCGLYGDAPGTKGNFIKTMLRLGGERRELRVVDDQHCTPTAAGDLAAAMIKLIATEAWGLYHATNAGQTTWHGLACAIFRKAGMEVAVQPISSSEYGAKAKRPAFSVLDSAKLAGVIGQPLPAWEDALDRYLGK